MEMLNKILHTISIVLIFIIGIAYYAKSHDNWQKEDLNWEDSSSKQENKELIPDIEVEDDTQDKNISEESDPDQEIKEAPSEIQQEKSPLVPKRYIRRMERGCNCGCGRENCNCQNNNTIMTENLNEYPIIEQRYYYNNCCPLN